MIDIIYIIYLLYVGKASEGLPQGFGGKSNFSDALGKMPAPELAVRHYGPLGTDHWSSSKH